MYRSILVPLDGSPLSERALPLARDLARATGARLGLVQVAWTTEPVSHSNVEAKVEALDTADAYLRAIAEHLGNQGNRAETLAMPYDKAAEGILHAVPVLHADLIVMSTHGRSGLGRWVYGSVAEAVLLQSPVPVLLVRGTGPAPDLGASRTGPRVIVPLDGSDVAETALPHAVALSQALNASMVLVRAIAPTITEAFAETAAPGRAEDPDPIWREQEVAKTYLSAVAQRLMDEAGVQVRTVVQYGPAAAAIVEEERLAAAGLVVMATHGRTGLARWFFGSVTNEVLHRGTLPLLLVRSPGVKTALE